MKVSSIAEHACPDTHSAMTAASKTSPEQTPLRREPYLQLSSPHVICKAAVEKLHHQEPGGKVQRHLSKLNSNCVPKRSSSPDAL